MFLIPAPCPLDRKPRRSTLGLALARKDLAHLALKICGLSSCEGGAPCPPVTERPPHSPAAPRRGAPGLILVRARRPTPAETLISILSVADS